MKIKPLVISAMLVAVSFIGANIKIMNTIAFDSMPGFFASIFLGPVYGAVIAAMGHFFTAMLSGFPLSLPVHILIMLDMAITMLIFGNIYSKLIKKGTGPLKSIIIAGIAGVIVNGPGSIILLLPFLLPMIGETGLLLYLPVLSGAAALNIILAFVVYRSIMKINL